MTRFLLLIALTALGGCATTSSDYYRDGRYYGDAGYSDGYYDDGYSADGYYAGGYAGDGDYYGDYYYGSSGYTPDYLLWPTYYSIFWPINHWYVDPYYYPGYYYGVTYFPRDYWSLSLTWGNHYRYGYAYNGYWNYSPYRYSWADNYYDWYPWYGRHSHHRDRHDSRPRYGSARNEAERVMALRDQDRARLGSAAYRGRSPAGSNAVTSPDRRGPRAAYYPSGQDSTTASTGNRRSSARAASGGNRASRDELVRNAQYRRALPDSKPTAQRVEPRASTRVPVRSNAKPAREYRPLSIKPAQRSVVAPARNVDDLPRVRGSDRSRSTVIRNGGSSRMPSSRSSANRGQVYRTAPPTRRAAPVQRDTSSYRAPVRATSTPQRYSRPVPSARAVDSYQRPAATPAPRSYGGGSYRAPPAVPSSRAAPALRSTPSDSGRSSSSKGSSRSSSSSRVRAARQARDDD